MDVSTGELAEILGIGERQVQSLAKKGVLSKLAHGRWAVGANVRAYLDHRIESEVSRVLRDPGEARVRDLRAQEIELRIEERSGALIAGAVNEAIDILTEIAGPLRSDMLSIPPRVTKDLSLRRVLENEILDVFGVAAKRCSKLRRDAELKQEAKRP